MRKLIKISLVVVLILFLIFATTIYLFAFGFSTKEYKNDFISFSYPSTYSLTMENTINSHELQRNGKDLYGSTNLRFKNFFGLWINVDSFSVDLIEDKSKNILKDSQELFETKKTHPADSFEIFTDTSIPGYKQKLTFFIEQKDGYPTLRSGSVEIGFLGKTITAVNIPWTPNNTFSAKFYELQAVHFANTFVGSFVEVQ